MLNLPPLPLVELYVELQSDEAEISQAYSYNNLISTLAVLRAVLRPVPGKVPLDSTSDSDEHISILSVR